MRGEAKERGVVKGVKWDEKEVKKTWTEIIPKDMWEEVAVKLNLSSEYVKGTITANRHITYQAYLNKTAEEIRINSQRRYRTDTEIFRVSVHLGMNILWNIFCRKPEVLKKSRSKFFYETLMDVEKNMERATMAQIINTKKVELSKMLSKGTITYEEAQTEIKKLWDSVPEDDLDYVKKCIPKDDGEKIKNIGHNLMKDLLSD